MGSESGLEASMPFAVHHLTVTLWELQMAKKQCNNDWGTGVEVGICLCRKSLM